MNFCTKTLPYTLMSQNERRKSPRKPLRHKVVIGVTDQSVLHGYTMDISAGGLSVLVPVALKLASQCGVLFSPLIDGQLVKVVGVGTVVNCSCAGLDGFRVGMQLKVQSPAVQHLLNNFIESDQVQVIRKVPDSVEQQ